MPKVILIKEHQKGYKTLAAGQEWDVSAQHAKILVEEGIAEYKDPIKVKKVKKVKKKVVKKSNKEE
tara:strand:- start:853 stop:1050 length:198 start_codon:yes stop_codon:yes gene_type:complete